MMRQIVLVGPQGQVVSKRCQFAETFLARLGGLLGCERPPRGEGMLIQAVGSIHKIGMQFPIDAVYLGRKMQVLTIRQRLRLWRVHADSVLELPARECEQLGIAVGDRLAWGSLRRTT